MSDLPPYVVLNDPQETRIAGLRNPAEPLTFPLSAADKECIQALAAKFDREENCAGLAAPQIGFGKQIIIFAVPDDPELKKWRPDLVQTMPRTIWINPAYEPIGEEKHIAYEGCFSFKDFAGPVPRFKKIRYSAYTCEGTYVEGIAEGFLARLIQHEVDHLRGRCFIDYAPEKALISLEEYRERRKKAIES